VRYELCCPNCSVGFHVDDIEEFAKEEHPICPVCKEEVIVQSDLVTPEGPRYYWLVSPNDMFPNCWLM
jgi:hypothetical protein